jgi:hypothetical protein
LTHQHEPAVSAETQGLLFGALGVLAFSFTLPATRVAVPELGGTFIGLGGCSWPPLSPRSFSWRRGNGRRRGATGRDW